VGGGGRGGGCGVVCGCSGRGGGFVAGEHGGLLGLWGWGGRALGAEERHGGCLAVLGWFRENEVFENRRFSCVYGQVDKD
jgi:hypothetical protein